MKTISICLIPVLDRENKWYIAMKIDAERIRKQTYQTVIIAHRDMILAKGRSPDSCDTKKY